jgi:hypothetical protein
MNNGTQHLEKLVEDWTLGFIHLAGGEEVLW